MATPGALRGVGARSRLWRRRKKMGLKDEHNLRAGPAQQLHYLHYTTMYTC